MVVQKTVDKLKQGTHEEKSAVATSAAFMVVVVLLIGWAFIFMKKIQRNALPTIDTGAIPEGLYDASAIREAEQTGAYYQTQFDQLEQLRENAAQEQVGTNAQIDVGASQNNDTSSFGSPRSGQF